MIWHREASQLAVPAASSHATVLNCSLFLNLNYLDLSACLHGMASPPSDAAPGGSGRDRAAALPRTSRSTDDMAFDSAAPPADDVQLDTFGVRRYYPPTLAGQHHTSTSSSPRPSISR